MEEDRKYTEFISTNSLLFVIVSHFVPKTTPGRKSLSQFLSTIAQDNRSQAHIL